MSKLLYVQAKANPVLKTSSKHTCCGGFVFQLFCIMITCLIWCIRKARFFKVAYSTVSNNYIYRTSVYTEYFTECPRGTQRQFSGKYLFGRRFETRYNFRNICCKISCLPASPRIFEHLQSGIITHFKRIFTLKKAT